MVHSIPPRPKPGRKPATDHPESKRKAQNRESQRAFRARKQAKTEELLKQIEDLKATHRTELATQSKIISDLEAANHELREQLHRTRTMCIQLHQGGPPTPGNHHGGMYQQMMPYVDARAESPLPASFAGPPYGTPSTAEPFGCGDCKPDNCACMQEITNDMALDNSVYIPMEAVALPGRNNKSTPMAGVERTGKTGTESTNAVSSEEIEIDFTAKFARTAANTAPMPEAGNCGFCDGHPEMCLCKDESLRPLDNDTTTLSRIASHESMRDIEPPVKGGPGSCADCQANPRMREWCQGVARIAQLRADATPPASRRGSARSISLDVMEPKVESRIDHNRAFTSGAGERSIGCSEAFKLLDGRVPMDLDSDTMDWRNLKPVQNIKLHHNGRSDSFTMEPGTYSAMELDASSILTTLQHSRQKLEPRPSDGAYASLVRQAEEQRRTTLSPRTGVNEPAGLAPISTFSMSE